jgi:DNA-binding NtrC family response regulator
VSDGESVDLQLHDSDQLGRLRGRSPEMRHLMARIELAAKSQVPLLLLGETGTGKEVIAHEVHEASPRASGPFETVDCAALIPTLIASELFGHERGAFTGADQQHIGAFERANGGTIFLDEIGELPPQLQSALLGAIERRSFRRVGGSETIKVDVRLVCATHRDLRGEVNAGTFRQDLYYRIAVVLIRIPALREHIGDIPLLVEHFMREAGYDGPIDDLVPTTAIEAMRSYSWPGNVRELRNFVEATFATGAPPDLREHRDDEDTDLPLQRSSVFPSVPIEALLSIAYKDARARITAEFEKLYFTRLLEETRWNISKTARRSEMNRSYLNQVVKRLKKPT